MFELSNLLEYTSYMAVAITFTTAIITLISIISEGKIVGSKTILLVQGSETDLGVGGAVVSVEVAGKKPLDGKTDSRGFAQLVIPDSFWDRPGRIIVEAEGYPKYVKNIDFAVEPLPNIIELEN